MVDSDWILGKHIKNMWSSIVKQLKEEVVLGFEFLHWAMDWI